MSASTALLVVSCDAYQDLWGPFFTLLFRYWPDCPYRVFLGSNDAIYPDRRVAPLAIGEDRNWSSNLLKMLELIPSDGVLLLQEDFLIDRPVQTERITQLIGYAEVKQAACLRLMPIPGPDDPRGSSGARYDPQGRGVSRFLAGGLVAEEGSRGDCARRGIAVAIRAFGQPSFE